MYDTGTVCHGYITVTGDVVSLFMLLFAGRLYKIKQRLILFPLKVCTLVAFEDLVCASISICFKLFGKC